MSAPVAPIFSSQGEYHFTVEYRSAITPRENREATTGEETSSINGEETNNSEVSEKIDDLIRECRENGWFSVGVEEKDLKPLLNKNRFKNYSLEYLFRKGEAVWSYFYSGCEMVHKRVSLFKLKSAHISKLNKHMAVLAEEDRPFGIQFKIYPARRKVVVVHDDTVVDYKRKTTSFTTLVGNIRKAYQVSLSEFMLSYDEHRRRDKKLVSIDQYLFDMHKQHPWIDKNVFRTARAVFLKLVDTSFEFYKAPPLTHERIMWNNPRLGRPYSVHVIQIEKEEELDADTLPLEADWMRIWNINLSDQKNTFIFWKPSKQGSFQHRIGDINTICFDDLDRRQSDFFGALYKDRWLFQ